MQRFPERQTTMIRTDSSRDKCILRSEMETESIHSAINCAFAVVVVAIIVIAIVDIARLIVCK